jgi:hypothetical protein
VVTREVRGQAKRATPPLQDIGLDRGGRLGAHLEYRQDLPAFPAVLRQAQPGRVRDADLRGGEFRVGDEIYERCAVRRRQGRRAVRRPPLELVSVKPGAFRIPSAHDVHRLHRIHRGPCTALAPVEVIWWFLAGELGSESGCQVVISERSQRAVDVPPLIERLAHDHVREVLVEVSLALGQLIRRWYVHRVTVAPPADIPGAAGLPDRSFVHFDRSFCRSFISYRRMNDRPTGRLVS